MISDSALSDELLTRDQAITYLISEVIEPNEYLDYYVAFGPQDLLEVGDSVKLGGADEEIDVEDDEYVTVSIDKEVYNITGPTWFFFVDTNKWGKWAHKTFYVYIDATNTTPSIGNGIVVNEHNLWPKINNVDYMNSFEDRSTTEDRCYGTFPTITPTLPLPPN